MTLQTNAGYISVWVTVRGPNGISMVEMALDTGATLVTIPLDLARTVGYDLAHPDSTTPIVTASGMARAPLVTLDSVEVLGAEMIEVSAICMDLPRNVRFRGLLGLSFLRSFDVDLHFRSGILRLS